MTLTNLALFSSAVDEQQRQQAKHQFLASEKQYIDLLYRVDKKLKGKEQYTPFKDWLAAAKVLEKVHQILYNKLDSSGQDNGIMDIMIEWGMTIEVPYVNYIRAYTPIQKQHETLLCVSVKTVIKGLSTTSPFSSIDGLLAAPFDQLKLYQSIYQTLLDLSNPSKQQQDTIKEIIQVIDTLLKQRPPRMVDSASSNDLQSFQKFVDCDHVIDLFTKNQLDYQLRSRPGRIILQDDFLLLADNNDQPALRIHMVLTTDILMICKQMVESTGRYDLLYPPLAVNDITVQPLMLDRELIGEYTLEFTVLNKNLIVRAESREIRNAWTGMPLTTTAKNAVKTRVSLANVVREAGNYNSNTTIGSNQSAVSLNSTISNRKSNIGALYGNTDISPVESSEDEDDDDDDDDDDSDDDDDESTSSGHPRQSLVNKKSLPSVPASQLPPPKKDTVAPPPKDLATPMINVSLHGDNNINHNNKQRGSSARAPLTNPAYTTTAAPVDSKSLPRSTSNRNRQTGSPSPGPRPPMPSSNQSPMMMMMQRPQQHQMHHPQHSKQLPTPSPSSSSSRQHQHRSTSHGINGIPAHLSQQNAPNRPRMVGPPQPQSSARPNTSHQRPPSSHHQFQQRPPYINHNQQRPPQNHIPQQRFNQQRSSQYHQQPQQRPPHHHQHQAQQRSSQHHPSHQRPPQQRPPQQRPQQRPVQHHQRPPPHFQHQQQQPSPPTPLHHNLNSSHPQIPAPPPTNVSKPLPQTTAAAPTPSAVPAQAAMAKADPNASLQRPMPPTPPPQKSQFASPSSSSLSPSSPASSQENLPQSQSQLSIPLPTVQEPTGPSLHLSPEELATPPRSPNPYNNQTNGIRQVLFRNQQCEVFRWNDESWYAVDGQCLLEVRQTFTNRSCVAIRVQTTGELYLNAWVLPQTQIRLASSTDVSLGLIMGSQQETYLVHFEQSADATELNQVLQKMHHAAVLASRQPNDGQQTLRGEPPTEMMIGMQLDDDEDHDDDDDGDNAVMMAQGTAISTTTIQSGQESTAIPQTLQPAMKCKCKLFVQNEHSNWSSFGSVQLVVSLQVPSRRMHIQIDHDKKRGFSKIIPTGNTSPSSSPSSPSSTSLSSSLSPDNGIDATAGTTTTASTLVSATVYSNNVERLGSKRISFLLVNEQERTSSMVYMVQLREEESGNTLYDYLKIKNSQNGW